MRRQKGAKTYTKVRQVNIMDQASASLVTLSDEDRVRPWNWCECSGDNTGAAGERCNNRDCRHIRCPECEWYIKVSRTTASSDASPAKMEKINADLAQKQ